MKVIKYDRTSHKDGFHKVNSDLIEISERSYPHTMHDLVQSSQFDFKIPKSLGTFSRFEALHLMLMVMSRSHNSGNSLEMS